MTAPQPASHTHTQTHTPTNTFKNVSLALSKGLTDYLKYIANLWLWSNTHTHTRVRARAKQTHMRIVQSPAVTLTLQHSVDSNRPHSTGSSSVGVSRVFVCCRTESILNAEMLMEPKVTGIQSFALYVKISLDSGNL